MVKNLERIVNESADNQEPMTRIVNDLSKKRKSNVKSWLSDILWDKHDDEDNDNAKDDNDEEEDDKEESEEAEEEVADEDEDGVDGDV